MNPSSQRTFFLGANTQNGFHSLYSEFAAGPNDFLHIIKAGPGTGKSTFMRRIAQAARERGYQVESILCSGDPDSLDGIFIPALHIGWADGTAPHAIDPRFFGASGAYVDLGQFCNTGALRSRREEIEAVTVHYKAYYKQAYGFLRAAGAVRSATAPGLVTADTAAAVEKRAAAAARREFGSRHGSTSGKAVRRFVSALTCQGQVALAETVRALCPRMILLENQCGLADSFLQTVLEYGLQAGAQAIVCPDPLCPEQTEAVLFPGQGLGFLAAAKRWKPLPTERTIHLDALSDQTAFRTCRTELRENEKLQAALLDRAAAALQNAKDLHDQLERIYRPWLNTAALDSFTGQTIDRWLN